MITIIKYGGSGGNMIVITSINVSTIIQISKYRMSKINPAEPIEKQQQHFAL